MPAQLKKSSTTPAPSTSFLPSTTSATPSPRTSSSSLSSIIAATLRVFHVPSRSNKSFKRSKTLPAPTLTRAFSDVQERGRAEEREPEWMMDEDGNVSGFGTALAKFPTRESVSPGGMREGAHGAKAGGKSRAGRAAGKLEKRKSS